MTAHSLALTVIFTTGVLLLVPADAEEAAFPVTWASASVEGASSAPARLEPVAGENGLRLILQQRKDAWNTIRIPVVANCSQANLLKFRARFDSPDRKLHGFQVMLMDARGLEYSTSFLRQARQQKDGSYNFSWDVINEPNQDGGADLENLREIRLKFNFGLLPAKEDFVVTLSDMRFVAGPAVAKGDPVRFAKWKQTIGGYQPDYSDSSRFLEPPATGRLAEQVALVKNGKALAQIVLAGDTGETEKLAGGELQHWIREITGAEMPLVHEMPESGEPAILLGAHFAKDRFSGDLAKLAGSDGFAVRAEGERIFIFGAQQKGTMNGVFAFLENNSDLIWARPNPDYGTVFSKSPDFSAHWGDALDRPAAQYRGWLPDLGGEKAFWLWSDRNKNNYVASDARRDVRWGDRVEFGGGHNLQTFIPKDDPRYYPTIGGKKPEKLSIWKHQICLSVPGLVKTYAGNVVNYIKEKAPPELEVFNIKIEDNWGVCECEKCLAPLTLPDGTVVKPDHPAFRSTQFFQFLNRVTEEVNKTFPGLKIQTYAYFFTAVPPLVKLNNNIYVLFCPYVRKDHLTPLYSPINTQWWERLTEWSKITPNLVIREYYGILNEGRPLAEVVAADVQADLELGVRNFAAEIMPDLHRVWSDGALRGGEDEFDLSAMDYWLINRIYWNPKANIEELRKYYLRRTFREAAPMMEKFFGTVRQGWFEKLRPPSTWGNSRSMWQRTVLAKGKEEAMRQYLEEALQKASHPASRILISRVRERFLHDIELAKNPGEKKAATALTPQERLYYGWSPINKINESYATFTEQEGRFLPAVRLILREGEKGKPAFNDQFPFDVSGMTFRFVVIPVGGQALPASLPLLSITDEQWRVETAPETSYSPSTKYPNAMEFAWTPTGQGPKGSVIDLKKITRLQLFVPETGKPQNESIELILIELSADTAP